MNQKLMISYSRQQTPFVNRLDEELEKAGYSIWLDYQSLVPAKPWYDQIKNGISGADMVLLVVSKDSIGSKNVEPEWKLALELKKRIILLIFEAVPLPDELKECKWVDFRVNHKKSLKQLKDLLEDPSKTVPMPAPQSGFKAPKRFWLALILSATVALGSIHTWWTLFIPFVLLPLPLQIYKRNYSFSRVISALLFLPFFMIVTSVFFFAEGSIFFGLKDFSDVWAFPAAILGWILLGLLLTAVMQRRARPEAARVRFANPLVLDMTTPRPVTFSIDHAPEDGRYAEDLRRGLEKHHHRLAGADEKPEAVFVLISSYKKRTKYNPDEQAVYPIILQSVQSIETKLQRIQWLDFRNGMGNINKLAKLLPKPEQLLKALAVAPTGSQEVFPLSINALQYFYLIVGVLGGGGILTSMLSFGHLILRGDVGWEQMSKLSLLAVQGALLFGLVFYSVRGLRTRRGGTAAAYPLLVLTLFQAVIYLSTAMTLTLNLVEEVKNEGLRELITSASWGTIMTIFAFPVGLIIVLPFLLFRWREFYRWLPRHQWDFTGKTMDVLRLRFSRRQWTLMFQMLISFRWGLLSRWLEHQQENMVGIVENAFLLYTPRRWWVLFFHIVFHVLLFFIFIIVLFSIGDASAPRWLAVILALFALGIHRLAKRFSK